MIKKISKHGNSKAIIIEKALLEILNINESTDLEISTDGTSLVITPIKKRSQRAKKFSDDKQLQKIIEEDLKKYAPLWRKLAKN